MKMGNPTIYWGFWREQVLKGFVHPQVYSMARTKHKYKSKMEKATDHIKNTIEHLEADNKQKALKSLQKAIDCLEK
jgi:hypothetical protein